MNITQFTMEEVRCFGNRQTLEIRPLTFLVGENSTGKTTTLACFHVLANYLRDREIDFNLDPYTMGIFKDLVRDSMKIEKAFKLGFVYKHAGEDVEWIVKFVEKEGRVEPTVSSIIVKFTDGKIVFEVGNAQGINPHLTAVDEKRNHYYVSCETDILTWVSSGIFLDVLKGKSEEKIALANYLKGREDFIKGRFEPWDIWDMLSVFSISPVRSRPKRTYDPMRESNDPEGSDVPMLLMRIEATEKTDWKTLKTQLVEFGKSSGLFQDIEIRNFGQSLGDPFQLQFEVRGPTSNIIDVGYGVSQILPILVHILNPDTSWRTLANYGEMPFFLLQQPEVHLHPRAQAELSSLLVNLASKGNRSFIVETHSDYMIDRARIEIRKGNIRPEDVSLIYLEPKGRIVEAHNIGFDKEANLTNVPPHYRDFFLRESKRLMGFED
jgi:predicted ATPase